MTNENTSAFSFQPFHEDPFADDKPARVTTASVLAKLPSTPEPFTPEPGPGKFGIIVRRGSSLGRPICNYDEA